MPRDNGRIYRSRSRVVVFGSLVVILAAIFGIIGVLLLLPTYSASKRPPPQPTAIYETPSLERVMRYMERGDAAFDRHSYGEAQEMFSLAMSYVKELKETDGRLGVAENLTTYEYLEATIGVKSQLAEIGYSLLEVASEDEANTTPNTGSSADG